MMMRRAQRNIGFIPVNKTGLEKESTDFSVDSFFCYGFSERLCCFALFLNSEGLAPAVCLNFEMKYV